ncbi:hypothetical protein BV25DRAFT_1805324 [Artomyces pyxidatus]|uniref:Uncharacterized protein n=1 Tax=Artomyces pyxidatus TaxID=48021 RepID=A0ACB8SZM2_9AGAM|nr:hypothetical protein BV25DRAFT_1805324 [Artomyces pyxidatus]
MEKYGACASSTPIKRTHHYRPPSGEITYLRVPGKSAILLNTQRVAVDLLEKRARICSSRPRFVLGSEIYTGGFAVALAYYGDTWRRLRRTAHEALNVAASKRYNPTQAKEATILTLDMLADGNEWNTNLRRHSAAPPPSSCRRCTIILQ